MTLTTLLSVLTLSADSYVPSPTASLRVSGNLLNISADAMDQVIQDVVWSEISAKGGNGAINVNIEYNAKIIDMLAAYFTIDIFSPAHLIVSGDVILYE